MLGVRSENGEWPEAVRDVFERFVMCDMATLSRAGTPIAYPLNPYIGEDGRTIDVTTGLCYPAKAERARRNPKVGLLFWDSTGSGLEDPPTVLVQGLATVTDRDIQANTDRYLRVMHAQMIQVPLTEVWYWPRIWTLVTPTRIWWWPGGRMNGHPERWDAPPGTVAPASDPAPPGRQPGADIAPSEWRDNVARAMSYGHAIVSVVDTDGYPFLLQAGRVDADPHGFRFELPAGSPIEFDGPASLLFERTNVAAAELDNAVFVGTVGAAGTNREHRFHVERALGDRSSGGSPEELAQRFADLHRVLVPRLAEECARRNQPVPVIAR